MKLLARRMDHVEPGEIRDRIKLAAESAKTEVDMFLEAVKQTLNEATEFNQSVRAKCAKSIMETYQEIVKLAR